MMPRPGGCIGAGGNHKNCPTPANSGVTQTVKAEASMGVLSTIGRSLPERGWMLHDTLWALVLGFAPAAAYAVGQTR
jgi:hypothetical protein